jgi:glycosyltransferase involved in cell wall biosynthesis
MQNPNSLHKEEFEFALLNPQFRDLPTHEIKRKLSAIVNSSEASKYALSIWSAVVDHGGIDNISAVADQLLNTTIKNIIISHEGSKSGAPVVCKNLAQSLAQNDTVILISFGTNYIFSNLEGVIVINFSSPLSRSGYWGFLLGKWLTELGCIDNATGIIGSTLETSEFIIGLCDALEKGSCTLLHEHPYYYGYEKLDRLLAASQSVIYSSEYVKNGWLLALQADADKYLSHQKLKRLPQPLQSTLTKEYTLPTDYPVFGVDAFQLNITGAGHIQPRKGVHLFIEIIAELARLVKANQSLPNLMISATWIGLPEHETEYSLYIKSKAKWLQRELNNLQIEILPLCDNYLDYIVDSHIFLSTSTVDPLPNVVLDSLCSHTPAFVLSGHNGHEEYFLQNGLDCLVLDPKSIHTSAVRLMDFISKPKPEMQSVHQSIASLINTFLTQEQYASAIRKEAEYANSIYDSVSSKARLLNRQGWNDVLQEYGSHFVSYQFRERQAQYGAIVAGLHTYWGYFTKVQTPLVAKYTYRAFLRDAFSPAISNFLSSSHPHIVSILDPNQVRQVSEVTYDVHIHAFYPDVALRLIKRLESLGNPPSNIFITFPGELDPSLRLAESNSSLNLVFIEVPNVGRNILPISHVINHLKSQYFIHLHTKKSTHTDSLIIDKWNEYLLRTIFGKEENDHHIMKTLSMMNEQDIAFAYPLEPSFQQLGRNTAGIIELLNRLSNASIVHLPIGTIEREMVFSYPCGCIFISETQFAKKYIARLIGLVHPSEVKEPLPYDGTLLHAMERCFPLLASLTGQNIGLILPPPGTVR